MMKVVIGLTVFIWAFYSHATECSRVETQISNKTKLYRELNEQTPRLINELYERKGSIDQVYITERCSNKLIIRYQTEAKSLKTGKTSSKKFFCRSEVSLKENDILKATCRAPRGQNTSDTNNNQNFQEPSAYPYGDVDDPFSNNNANSGPRYGDEPEYPSRNDDGPDSDSGLVLF